MPAKNKFSRSNVQRIFNSSHKEPNEDNPTSPRTILKDQEIEKEKLTRQLLHLTEDAQQIQLNTLKLVSELKNITEQYITLQQSKKRMTKSTKSNPI